jgi:hypothetical protein
MPSPFPGMNPYLEQEDAWHDFHERFIPHLANVLSGQLDGRYIVKVDEHVYVHELGMEERRFLGRPDIGVNPDDAPSPRASQGPRTAVLEAPVIGVLPAVDVLRLSNIEIRDLRTRQLVTVIELLSPSNKKPGADRVQYESKRKTLLASTTHLVEIDLLRGHQHMPVDKLPACDYCIMVSRYEDRPDVGLWPFGLRDPIPSVPVPLRYEEADASLDLQQALHDVYDAARYARYIYGVAPEPPLSPEDAAWTREILRQRVQGT